MITNFKLFEKEGDTFKIGTWVLLDDDMNDTISGTNGTLEIPTWRVYTYVKIIDKNSAKTHYNKYNEDDYEEPQNDYKIESFDLETKELKQFWVDASDIDRELTPEEIEETKIRIQAIKYNL